MTLADYPRILTVASALPPFRYTQDTVLEYGLERILGADWRMHEEKSGDATGADLTRDALLNENLRDAGYLYVRAKVNAPTK